LNLRIFIKIVKGGPKQWLWNDRSWRKAAVGKTRDFGDRSTVCADDSRKENFGRASKTAIDREAMAASVYVVPNYAAGTKV
jgi:hypothetical protein